jgi:ketosteroid isomerase-like protein
MTDLETNKAIVRQFMDDISKGRTDAMLATYAEDAVLTTTGNTLISGQFTKANIAAAAKNVFDVFPKGIAFDIIEMTAEADRVAVEARSHGDHVSGQHYSNYYHFLFRLRDGKITEMKEFMDTELVTDILCGGQRPVAAEIA